MLIQPATFAQVRTGRDGHRILVENDVLDVARRLAEIDPCLSLHWNENGEYFVVIETGLDGTEHLVTTSQELNPQLVDRVREIGQRGYDYGKELDRLDAQAQARIDHQFHERAGAAGEILAHALRSDLQAKNKAVVSRDV